MASAPGQQLQLGSSCASSLALPPQRRCGSSGAARRLGSLQQQPDRCGGLPALLPHHSSSSSSSTWRSCQHQHQQQQQQPQHQLPSAQKQPSRRAVAAHANLATRPPLEERSFLDEVNQLNAQHGAEGYFEFYEEAGSGQPVAYLMHPRGHTLEIQLQGATITRWLKPDGEDLLYVRPDATLAPGQAINSGIPLAFPQWRDGPLPHNGFADKLQWEVLGTDFDGEFTNLDVSRDDWASGAVRLALDEDGDSLLPMPAGVLDPDDVRGSREARAALAGGVDTAYASQVQQAVQEAAAGVKPKRTRGRKKTVDAAAAAEAEAAAAAAAAEADAAAAVAAKQQADADAVAAAADAAAAEAAAADAAAAAAQEQAAEAEGGGDEASEAAALAAAMAAAEGFEFGLMDDPAPCIILKLEDSEETRAIWPHKFELYYKITLSETDEFPDPKEGLPRGAMTEGNGDALLGPEELALRELLDDDDPEVAAAAAAALAESFRASNIRAGIGAPALLSERESELDFPSPGQPSYTGFRQLTDEDGQGNEEDDSEDYDDAESSGAGASGPALRGAAKASVERQRAKLQQEQAAAAELQEQLAAAGAEGAAAAAAGEGGGEGDEEEGGAPLTPGMYNPAEPPMQVKMEWILLNKDPEGSPPFSFQLGALSHFRTEDQMRHGEFVRVLGLGGVTAYDWSEDSRRARLVGNEDDYLVFDGDRHDSVFIGSHDADVSFCPGTRTHFQLIARQGVPDHVVYHPGAYGLPGLEVEPRFFAQVGAGRLALPKKLAPGEMWRGEYVIRHHERYWDPPVFDRNGAEPMPKLFTQRDDADDREEVDDDHVVEGVVGSGLGGGAHVPYMDE